MVRPSAPNALGSVASLEGGGSTAKVDPALAGAHGLVAAGDVTGDRILKFTLERGEVGRLPLLRPLLHRLLRPLPPPPRGKDAQQG